MLDTSPVWGCLPLGLHPTHSLVSLCISMFQGYLCDVRNISPLLGVLALFPNLLGTLGASAHGVSICLFLYILVVHHVSCFYYGYDYFSSSYGGVFLPVIGYISDCGSFPDGAFCNIGPAWSGSTTTLDAERLWRCYWPCLCPSSNLHLQCLFWLMPIMLWVLHREVSFSELSL